MSLVGANGKAPAKPEEKIGPIPVTWAVVVGVREGMVYLIDHTDAVKVRSQRPAHLDDIASAAYLGGQCDPNDFEYSPADEQVFTIAFLVFQLPEGPILASPDVFLDVVPMMGPTGPQLAGALGVLQLQIIAQKVLDGLKLTALEAAYAEKKNKSSLVTV